MDKKINLFWFRHTEGHGNFGDELNPYIISKLTGKEVSYVDVRYLHQDKWIALKIISKALLKKKISIFIFIKYLYYNYISTPDVLLCIGSILHFNLYNKCQVWGSGIIDNYYNFNNANFFAVRGKYSQDKLKELGYDIPKIVGDPALLLPLLYKPGHKKKYKIGVIPHYVHYKDVKGLFPADVLVINLLDDIETVINQICECELTLSTSLHGIIVSHAYGVPSIWTEFTEIQKKLRGNNIKFKDYFSSVSIREYEGLIISNVKGNDFESIMQQVNVAYNDVLLPPKKIIGVIQDNLLKVAPFPLKIKR